MFEGAMQCFAEREGEEGKKKLVIKNRPKWLPRLAWYWMIRLIVRIEHDC